MRAKKLEFVVGGVLPANNRSRGHAWFDKVFYRIHLLSP